MTSSRQPAPPPTRAPEGGNFRQHPRPSGRRILFFSLLASALIHLLVIVVYPILMERGFAGDPVREAETPELPDEAMRVLSLRELREAGPEESVEPEPSEAVAAPPEDPDDPDDPEEPDETEPTDPVTAPPVEGAVAAPDAPAPTPAERLQPHMVDPRLWREVGPGAGLSDADRARIRVYGLMEEWGDSIAALEEAERRALDWTYTDDEGRRWGISPGRIHLGEFSLPLPIHFSTPPGLRDEVERRAWEWEEIERGAASAAVRDALKNRAQEIRARRNAERGDTLGVRP
ncbi:MAG: hypothetical protein WDZ89_01865 [Gemmatimonadota bacterium]